MDMSSSTISIVGSMSSAMTSMPEATTTAMASSHDMSMQFMGMDMMAMTFFTSTMTPLFSMSWSPTTAGQYAGTCIFLIAFAAVFRALLAVRVNFYEVLAAVKHRRGEDLLYSKMAGEKLTTRPWRASEALYLSSMDVILAGVGYLLMIAVMTMNVGYFLSVLAGVFVGSFVFGHFMAHSAAH